jgi:glycosyltransferase involved in cell wall biosynthesis
MTVAPGLGLSGVRVVLAHDYLTEMAGAERVVATLVGHLPDAPLLTSGFRPDAVDDRFSQADVRLSALGPLLADKGRAKVLFPLLPLVFRRIDVPACDLLLSSTSGFAHHARPPAGAVHVAYCHTPPRFLWNEAAYFLGRRATHALLRPALAAMRALDLRAARRVDAIIANSSHTARRILEVYGRDAAVLPPPVDVDTFHPTRSRSGRFLVVSRLLAYKRIDLAVRAAELAGAQLDIIGEGPDRTRLEAIAGPGVRFLGRRPDPEMRAHMAACTALLVPGVEDFGLTIVEAQASGRPPIAAAAGGALESVEDGRTGFLVAESTPEGYAAAMRRAMDEELPEERLVAAARRFDVPVFLARLDGLLLDALAVRRSSVLEPVALGRA